MRYGAPSSGTATDTIGAIDMAKQTYYGTGRRKTSAARVYLKSGGGEKSELKDESDDIVKHIKNKYEDLLPNVETEIDKISSEFEKRNQ